MNHSAATSANVAAGRPWPGLLLELLEEVPDGLSITIDNRAGEVGATIELTYTDELAQRLGTFPAAGVPNIIVVVQAITEALRTVPTLTTDRPRQVDTARWDGVA